MKKEHILLLVSFIVITAVGIIFGLFHYEYLLLQKNQPIFYNAPTTLPIHKTAVVCYQKDDLWQSETVDVATENIQDSLHILVQQWLTILQEEGIISKNIALQSTLVDALQNNAYLSFDKSLFLTNSSTYQKIVIVVSLAKTITSLHSSLQKYMLLVDDKPLPDYHIDCHAPFVISYLANVY